MHVSDVSVDVSSSSVFGMTWYTATVQVTVVDTLDRGIGQVKTEIQLLNGITGTAIATTDGDGVATFTLPMLPTSSFTACVSKLTQDYFNTYDSGSNVVTCVSN